VPVPLTIALTSVEPAGRVSGAVTASDPVRLAMPIVVPNPVMEAPGARVMTVPAGSGVGPRPGTGIVIVPTVVTTPPVTDVDPVTVAVPVNDSAKIRPVLMTVGFPPRVKVPPRVTGPVMVHVMGGDAGC